MCTHGETRPCLAGVARYLWHGVLAAKRSTLPLSVSAAQRASPLADTAIDFRVTTSHRSHDALAPGAWTVNAVATPLGIVDDAMKSGPLVPLPPLRDGGEL